MSDPGWQDADYDAASSGRPLRQDRSTTILVFGILGLVVCGLFGLAALLMGNEDLRAMDMGEMDPRNRSTVVAGRTLGIVSLALIGLMFSFFLLAFTVGLISAGAEGGR